MANIPAAFGPLQERDVYGNIIGTDTGPVNPPSVPSTPQYLSNVSNTQWKHSPFRADIRGIMNKHDFQSEIQHINLAAFDPANPSQPTIGGGNLHGYLSNNPGAVSWLLGLLQRQQPSNPNMNSL